MFKNKWLWGIIVIAFALRIVGLSDHPAGFTADEASFGYDAYSILKTGQDQWGNFFPLNLKSFGDYKLPLYTYLSIPSVALFGLNVFSARLLSALLGSLSIIAAYLLVNELFKNKKLAFFAGLFLALSPWHIALSRGAYEANLTSFFLPLGLWALIKTKQDKRYLWFAAILLGFNLFSYHTARLLTIPIVIFFVFLTKQKHLYKSRQALYIMLFLIGAVAFSMLNGGAARLATSNVFSLAENVFTDRIRFMAAGEPTLLAKVFNNKFSFVVMLFFKNYLDYFSPQFWFTEGTREATYGMIPGVGVLHAFEIVTLLAGLVYLIKNPSKEILFIVGWIVLAPIPAALSLGSGLAANRASFMMPALQIFSAFGLFYIYKLFKKREKLFNYALAAILFFSVVFFAESYWFKQPVYGAKQMHYGMRELVEYVSKIEDQYEGVLVTKKISEGHIYFAFFGKVEPKIYQEATRNWNFEDQGHVWVDQLGEYSLGKTTFRDFSVRDEFVQPGKLLVIAPDKLMEDMQVMKTIYYPDGQPAYYLIDTRVNVFAKNKFKERKSS